MRKILKLYGTDPKVYELLAPLIMNPRIIKQNNGYPFKTTKEHTWLVTIENGAAIAFMPIENRDSHHRIDNYYIPTSEKEKELFGELLQRIQNEFKQGSLIAMARIEDMSYFEQFGYEVVRVLKRYIVMKY